MKFKNEIHSVTKEQNGTDVRQSELHRENL